MNKERRPHYQPVTIKIFQANVDKCQESHSAALNLAYTEGFNVVILQEPNTSFNQQKGLCRTQHHPGFTCFSPVDHWNSNDTRPRVMTYVKIDKSIRAEQLAPTRHRDLLWVRVNDTTILNIYNRPEARYAPGSRKLDTTGQLRRRRGYECLPHDVAVRSTSLTKRQSNL